MSYSIIGFGEVGRRVVFLASDDDNAVPPVAALAERLGFAPVHSPKAAHWSKRADTLGLR